MPVTNRQTTSRPQNQCHRVAVGKPVQNNNVAKWAEGEVEEDKEGQHVRHCNTRLQVQKRNAPLMFLAYRRQFKDPTYT